MATRRTKLPGWSGPERWEKTLPDGPAWIEMRAGDETHRSLRNELGDRWTETIAEVEGRRGKLRKEGWLLVRLTEQKTRTGRDPLAEQVLDAALRLTHGQRHQPVRFTKLRSQVAAVRSDFDDAVRQLHDTGKVVLSRDDDTAQLTDDDREAAIYVGDSPRHLIYVL